MRHSVFWKIIIGSLIVITLTEVGLLLVLYKSIYENEVEDATRKIKFAASSSALALEGFDPDDLEDYKSSEPYLNDMCYGLGITYLYVLKPDIENRDEMYLVRGYGKNASKEYINNRYSGYVVKDVLREEQISVMNGKELVVIHEANSYDDTLMCYTPVKKYWSTEKKITVNGIKSMVCAEVSVRSIMENINARYFVFVILPIKCWI